MNVSKSGGNVNLNRFISHRSRVILEKITYSREIRVRLFLIIDSKTGNRFQFKINPMPVKPNRVFGLIFVEFHKCFLLLTYLRKLIFLVIVGSRLLQNRSNKNFGPFTDFF